MSLYRRKSFFWKKMGHVLQESLYLRFVWSAVLMSFCFKSGKYFINKLLLFMPYFWNNWWYLSNNHSDTLMLYLNGPVSQLNIILFGIPMQTNRLSKNNLIGYCEIDLYDFLTRVSYTSLRLFLSMILYEDMLVELNNLLNYIYRCLWMIVSLLNLIGGMHLPIYGCYSGNYIFLENSV